MKTAIKERMIQLLEQMLLCTLKSKGYSMYKLEPLYIENKLQLSIPFFISTYNANRKENICLIT